MGKELIAYLFYYNYATVHFSAKFFVLGHFSGHTGSNDTSLKFVSCRGAEKRAVRETDRQTDTHTHTHTHTHTQILSFIYIDW